MKLVPLAYAKLFMDKTDTENDALLNLLIDQISTRIETYTNREFVKQARARYYNGGRKYYYLPAFPIEGTVTVSAGGVLQEENSDYWLWDDEGLVEFRTPPSSTEPKWLYISWTGGYTKDEDEVVEVPEDLQRACLMQVVFEFKRRKDLGLASLTMPDGSIAIANPADLLPEVEQILRSHRRNPY